MKLSCRTAAVPHPATVGGRPIDHSAKMELQIGGQGALPNFSSARDRRAWRLRGGRRCEGDCPPRQQRLRIRAGRREMSWDRVHSAPKCAGFGKGTHPPNHPGTEPVAVPSLARLFGRLWKETCATRPATMFHVKHRAHGSTFCEQRLWRGGLFGLTQARHSEQRLWHGGLFRLTQALHDVSRETRPQPSTLHAATQPIVSGPLPGDG